MSGREQAEDFLDGAARHRQSVMDVETARLNNARKSGALAKDAPVEEINKYAEDVAYHAQAKGIIDNPPSRGAMEFMRQQVDKAQNEKGSTYTAKYGDMRTSAAKQRASNTKLNNQEALHDLSSDGDDDDALDVQLGGEMAAAARDFDPQQMKKAAEESLLTMREAENKQFDPHQLEEAKKASLMELGGMAPIQQHTAGMYPSVVSMGSNPPHSLLPTTPHLGQKQPADETPADIAEVRDEAMMEIVVGSERDPIALQGVVDGLCRPRDQQMVKVNNLLVKKNKNVDERLDGLAKFEQNRRKSRDK